MTSCKDLFIDDKTAAHQPIAKAADKTQIEAYGAGNVFPEYVRSIKEKECWILFQKMINKGISVSYETIMRGMLTPTEVRAVQKKQKEMIERQASLDLDVAEAESSAKKWSVWLFEIRKKKPIMFEWEKSIKTIYFSLICPCVLNSLAGNLQGQKWLPKSRKKNDANREFADR